MLNFRGEVRAMLRVAALIALTFALNLTLSCASNRDWTPPQRPVMPLVEEIRPPSTDMRFVQRCPTSDFKPARTGPWVSAASERLTQTFPAAHRASDQILTTGQPVTLQAQLTYGEEPLVDEWARIFWGGCERGWEQVGQARTDDQGRVTWRLSRQVPRGRYAYAVQVAGDRTFVEGYIWVVAPEVRAVAISASAILIADTSNPAPVSEPEPEPEPEPELRLSAHRTGPTRL